MPKLLSFKMKLPIHNNSGRVKHEITNSLVIERTTKRGVQVEYQRTTARRKENDSKRMGKRGNSEKCEQF
jgi:hypothetical protein